MDIKAETQKGHFDIDGQGGAFLLIMKESEANTVETCRGVEREIAAIQEDPVFQGTNKRIFFNQADLIEFALDGLIKEGEGGAVMAVMAIRPV